MSENIIFEKKRFFFSANLYMWSLITESCSVPRENLISGKMYDCAVRFSIDSLGLDPSE